MIATQLSRLAWNVSHLGRTKPWLGLDDFDRFDPGLRRRILGLRLLAQIRHFGAREDALPEWREAARIRDVDELWRIWGKLPVVSKDLLQSRFEAQELAERLLLRGRVDSTGGSTGEPTAFFRDQEMLRAVRAADCYTRCRMGWKPGMPVVMVGGSDRDVGKSMAPTKRFGNWMARQIVVGGFGVDDSTVHRVVDWVEQKRPVAIWGYSSLLEFLAERALAIGKRPSGGSVATAWNGAEPLLPSQAALFREAFGVTPLNRYVGRELGAMACEFQPEGPLHVLRPWLYVEVVDDEGRPAAPGETGRLLWTSTICRGSPFLRYDIGDLGMYDADGIDESGIHSLRELRGRTGSMIEVADGRKITSFYWNHLLQDYPEVRRFQLLVDGRSLTLRLQGSGFGAGREDHLRNAISNLLGDTPVTLRWVDEIPRTAQGMLMQVVKVKSATHL